MTALTLLDDLQRSLAAAAPAGLAVAFSGGLDSSVLLHLLSRCQRARDLGLRALHVNHGIHHDAASWAERCAAFADELQVPFQALRCEVDRLSGQGLEAAARQARYAALSTELASGDWLTTAQHQDDQAETLLLRLLRGSGSRGLAAMREQRPLGNATLWRPLLNWPRSELQSYANEHGLRWIEDPSNRDPQHDRSWLRHAVLPILRRRWPSVSASLAASASVLAEESDLLEDAAARTLDTLAAADGSLPVDALLALGAAERASTLRLWLRQHNAPPLPRHLHAVLDGELLAAPADASPSLRWGEHRLRRYRNALSLTTDSANDALPDADVAAEPAIAWNGLQALDWPGGGRLSIEPSWTGPTMMVGHRQGGERILLEGRTHTHSLKKVLQSSGIPPWERQRMPLLWSPQGELWAAGDQLISQDMQRWLAASNARLVWGR